MQRYFLQPDGKLSVADCHHIKKVMRFSTGDQVELCFEGQPFLAKLTINEEISYEKLSDLKPAKQLKVDLYQGIPKGTKVDDVCKYATLFGVNQITFVQTIRSVAKIANEDSKIVRLSKIAKEAAQLSKRSQVPVINYLKSLKDISFADYDLIILLDEMQKVNTINQVVKSNQQKIALIVGPEGGIDEKERQFLLTKGAVSVTLGELIYPTELAALAFLSIIYQMEK